MELGRIDGRCGRRLDDGREAAVLVPVVDRPGGYHLVFIKRGDQLDEHPGQMSFPGGSREAYDADRYATALREANEEIGLSVDTVKRVGKLDDITTTTEYVISPFVSRIEDQRLTPDGREATEIAILPVNAFLSTANYEREWRTGPTGEDRLIHAFTVDDYRVWGATGRLVVQLLELTTDWRADDCVG